MKIGKLKLGQVPRIAAPFRDNTPAATIEEAIKFGLDIAELRIDEFTDATIPRVQSELTRFRPIPTIATVRSATEGGTWKGTETERAALYKAAAPHAAAIDIELSSTDILDEVAAAAREADALVIVSFHDFAKTPDTARLDDFWAQATSKRADLIKIAVTANTTDELRRFAAFTATRAETPFIAIAMGPMGALSRVFFPALGSAITFAHFGTPSAPGQIPYRNMAALMAQFYPNYRKEKTSALAAMDFAQP